MSYDTDCEHCYPQADSFNAFRSGSGQIYRPRFIALNRFADSGRKGRARLLVRLFSFSGAHLEPISHILLLRGIEAHSSAQSVSESFAASDILVGCS